MSPSQWVRFRNRPSLCFKHGFAQSRLNTNLCIEHIHSPYQNPATKIFVRIIWPLFLYFKKYTDGPEGPAPCDADGHPYTRTGRCSPSRGQRASAVCSTTTCRCVASSVAPRGGGRHGGNQAKAGLRVGLRREMLRASRRARSHPPPSPPSGKDAAAGLVLPVQRVLEALPQHLRQRRRRGVQVGARVEGAGACKEDKGNRSLGSGFF